MSGISWTFKEDGNCKFGYSWGERGKIDWFAYKGNSEEIKEIQEEIHKFKPDKDYSYTPNGKIENWEEVYGECEKYTIHNEELKKKLWKLTKGEEEDIELDIPEIPKIPINPIEPIEPIKPIKPIKKPTRPIGKRKDSEEWKDYDERMKQYRERMKTYAERMKEYSQRIQEYHKKMAGYSQKLAKNFGKTSPENNKLNETKIFPKCLGKKEEEWKWREFWIGVSISLILVGLLLLLIKLFRKKK